MHKFLTLLGILSQTAYAFPPGGIEAYARHVAESGNVNKRADNATVQLSKAQTNCGPTPCLVFVESEQKISTTGQHAYASPGPADIRGPCPGLNAAANHAYLPRNGVANIPQTIDGLGQLFGMSADLAGFLAAYAIIFDGDPITQTWSIGGPPPASSLGSGLLGKPQGISYSHNKYEGDTSIARPDAYLNNGDAHSLDVNRFRRAYEIGMDNDRYTMDKFRIASAENQYDSIRNNPYYFAPLFSTTLVAPAAYNFIINFMSNHTKEEPSGYLDGSQFKTWFGIAGDYPNFTWLRGQERIPENWYRRTSTNQYRADNVLEDLAIGWAAYPNTFRFGGNTGKVNTYTGIDIENFTGGAYNARTLFEGNNFACFFFQNQQQAVPDFAKGIVNNIAGVMKLFEQNTQFLSKLSCPQLAKFDNSVFDQYPGRSYSPTGPATNYK